jgi:hypothetical protein
VRKTFIAALKALRDPRTAPPKMGSDGLGLVAVAAVVVSDPKGRADGDSEQDAMEHQSEDGAAAHADAQSG